MEKIELRDLIQNHSLIQGIEVNLSSGQKSNYYFDLKQVTMMKRARELMAKLIWEMVKDDGITAVGGMESGAIPIIDAIIDLTPISHGFYVKKQPKKHGLRKFIEGILNKDDRILIVEDVSTKGNSALKCIEEVKREHGNIVRIITIVDRLEGAQEKFLEKGLKLEHLFTRNDFNFS
ncbi:MAG: orotate phosphoribosyltransferase [Candidatus Helarchaeota archaeon]